MRYLLLAEIANSKASDTDGMPNLVMKIAIAKAPEVFRHAMHRYLDEVSFP